MRLARWRAGPVIANFAKVVVSLQCATVETVVLSNVFRKLMRTRWNVPDHPMYPGAYRRVGIVQNEREASGLRGMAAPIERRRNVGSLASIGFRDGRSGGECRAGNGE